MVEERTAKRLACVAASIGSWCILPLGLDNVEFMRQTSCVTRLEKMGKLLITCDDRKNYLTHCDTIFGGCLKILEQSGKRAIFGLGNLRSVR